MAALRALFFKPVDIASLVAFRIAFGLIMFWEVIVYYRHDWIGDYWVRPAFHFTYPGFGWVQPWPGIGMYLHMAVLGVLGLCIAAGLFYRIATVLFCLGFTYTFLLEHTRYLNHFYFVCLVSFLMIFVPAHRAVSLDARRRPELHSETIPFWPVWLLRAQLGIIYVFAGIAKLNSDWFAGQPLNSWLRDLAATPILGAAFAWPATFHVISWSGLAFDLLVVPFLIWKRTRPYAFCAAVAFHLMNAWFFKIGIFPWFSIAMSTLFFEPDWPRKLLGRLRIAREWASRSVTGAASAFATPARQRGIALLVGGYVALHLTIPFRHWLYPGDVAWTEEGHQFSWRMKLRDKQGQGYFTVVDPATNEAWIEDPRKHLASWQVAKMLTRPELIRQFAHHLARLNEREIGRPVEVYATVAVRLNGRPPALLVDPEVNLAKEPHRIGPAPWITRGPSGGAAGELAGGR